MKPKLNKLITLLLLLGTFAFLMEAEERVTSVAKEELSRWASLLPESTEQPQVETLNPYAQQISIREVILTTFSEKEDSIIN